ncbi:MAG: hypothetical protein GYB68_11285 [Chloroflexi bacterium]|nr:hypothetical protein [Chloroflexota bacterium]
MLEMTWMDEAQDILHWKFSANWTGDELLDGFDQFMVYANERPLPPYSIIDFTESTGGPKNIMSLYPQMASRLTMPREVSRQVHTVIVIDTRYTRLIDQFLRVFTRVYGHNVSAFNTTEEAHSYLTGILQAKASS